VGWPLWSYLMVNKRRQKHVPTFTTSLPDLLVYQDHFVWVNQQPQEQTWLHASPSHNDPVHTAHQEITHLTMTTNVCIRVSLSGFILHKLLSQAVAAPHIWNRLPTDVVAANSLSTFRRLLKRFLFRQSYPDIIYWLWHHPVSGPCSGCAT